ncbi:MAG TPA: class I SAM-dependent methyltransferase [Streptosporangiaceae bacterium]|nr:class I SAM-dependent methyltransferase [Streptosporangiaceae bacterium]
MSTCDPGREAIAVYSDADDAALYDVLYPWDPAQYPADRFYTDLVMAAETVLDVGCGTGAMLHRAREQGHPGRLVGLDPDVAALDRARRRTDIEWLEATAAAARQACRPGEAGFALATMTSHAFQCLVTAPDLRESLAAIRDSLRDGGRFAFETRHPQARAWTTWTPANAADVTDAAGRALRVWHEVESVSDGVVTFTGTTAGQDGTVLRVGRESLRFLDVAELNDLLAGAGFRIEAQHGDWDGTPVTGTSREIITIARRG